MRVLIAIFITLQLSVTAAWADQDDLVARYFSALKMDDVFTILQEEGIAAAEKMAQEDEAVTQSPAWTSRVARIYATDKMDAIFRQRLSTTDNLDASEAAIEFFESALGQRIVDIELEARRALTTDAMEEAAKAEATSLKEQDPDRYAMYEDFIAANNLVESNLMGALNSNLAFYQGLGTNPLFGAIDEETVLGQVYDQAPEIRADMEEWTMNFSVLAYSLLTEEEMQLYIDTSETKAGQILNTALFAGFDKVFELHSFELGRALAEFMVGDET